MYASHIDRSNIEFVHIARVERTITGDVILHLIADDTMAELSEDAQYIPVGFRTNPFNPPNPSA